MAEVHNVELEESLYNKGRSFLVYSGILAVLGRHSVEETSGVAVFKS